MKKFLHEAFLAKKQQYPRDVLAMKRFMADFIGADTDKPKCPQQQQPKADPIGGTGVTFVSPGKNIFPVCHACGKQHDGGHLQCNSIPDKHCKRTNKLVKAGIFDNKSGSIDSGGGNTAETRTTGGNKPIK